MRILIDIGHPAHIHYFKNLIKELSLNHKFIITTKNIPVVIKLLNYFGFNYIIIGEKGKGILGKAIKQINFTKKICKIVKENKVDLLMGVSVSIAQASKICRVPSIYFDDDDLKASPLTAYLGTPFAKQILSPDVLSYENLKNAIYYPGYQELAYLHPNRFIANSEILTNYGINKDDKYFILRFTAFKAHHDINQKGMTLNQKKRLIKLLEHYGKVFITSEGELDPEFEHYKIPIEPYEIHDFLYYSQMLISDSQTMSSEAAVLGIPSFRCNSFAGRLSVLEEEEKRYGLTFGFLPKQFNWMLYRINEFLETPNLKDEWQKRRMRLLQDKIDVTSFWVWFVENYPESVKEVKSPEFSFDRFK